MHHELSLITTIAAALGFGLLFGMLAVRLKLPALVGYLAAGIVIGPATPGFVADVGLASQLAEIGVMLLMFGVGLHFSLRDLLDVKKIALPGAVLQIAVATGMGIGLAYMWDWSLGAGLVFGLALSVASTVVLLRALESLGILDSMNGRIAVGWLVVEDLVTVLVLVLLPALAGPLGGKGAGGDTSLWLALGKTLLQVGAFVAFMLVVGRKLFPWFLWKVAKTASRELFTLAVIAAAVGIAYGSSELFGVSFALGAFFAGMVLRESDLSHRAAEESLPLRDAFSVLFFVSVGMLFDPMVLVESPFKVLAVVAVIIFGKSLAAMLLVLALRYPLNTAITVSASLAQIGEFSFILAALGISLELMPKEGQSLILAGAIISIARQSAAVQGDRAAAALAAGQLRGGAQARSLARPAGRTADDGGAGAPHRPGRAGRLRARGTAHRRRADGAGRALRRGRTEPRTGRALRRRDQPAVVGNAAEPAVLIQAHIARAAVLVIATPDTFHVRKMVETANDAQSGDSLRGAHA